MGKVRAVAKGARKVQSRYASLTQPFSHIRFTAYAGSTLPTFSQAEAIEGFRSLREDLDNLAYGIYILDLVDTALVDRQPHDDILSLLIASLHILSHTAHRELLLAWFELRLLARLGVAMSLGSCPRCGGAPGAHLDIDTPGFLCQKCCQREGSRTQIAVSSAARSLLSTLRGGDWRVVEAIATPVAGQAEVAAVLDRVMFAQLEQRPESYGFLSAIRTAAQGKCPP